MSTTGRPRRKSFLGIRPLFAGALVALLVATVASAGNDTYEYDELGRLKAVTLPDGTRIDYALDAAGNRKTYTTTPVAPGTLQWTSSSASGSEGGSAVTLSVSRTAGNSGAVSVGYSVGGTATQGTDYSLSGSLSWASGDGANKSITATITDDPGYDPNETVILTLNGPTGGATLGSPTVITLTITDNDDGTPPSVPGTLSANSSGTPNVSLSWGASTDSGGSGLDSYRIERCQGAGCSDFAEIASTVPPTTSYLDQTTAASTPYVYRVRARDGAGNHSGYSNNAAVTTGSNPDTTPPTDPTNLVATPITPTRIDLAWTGSTDIGGSGVATYRVERCTGSGCGNFAEIGFSASPGYSDTTVADATTYQYRVRARDVAGNNSGYSNTASATTPDGTAPSAPTSLGSSSSSSSSANLSWTGSTDNVGVTSYRVERCTGAGCSNFGEIGSVSGSPPATSYVDSTTAGTTTYVYRVRARDAANNNSGYSNSSTVTTPDTIPPSDPSGLSTNVVSVSRIDLSWTGSSDSGGSGLADYRIERCMGSGCGNFAELTATASTSYSDTTVVANTTYRYRVRARDAANNYSGYSNIATGTTPQVPPDAPVLSSNFSTINAGGSYLLTWTTPAGTATFELYEQINFTGFSLVYSGPNAFYPKDNVFPPGDYRYYVKACNGAGCSANSNQVAILVCDAGGCQ